MKVRATVVGAALWSALTLSSAPQAAGPAPRPASQQPASSHPAADYRGTIDKYCVTCHNQRTKTAGLALDVMDLSDVAGGAEVWEKVVRKVRVGMMPPQGHPGPTPTRPTRW